MEDILEPGQACHDNWGCGGVVMRRFIVRGPELIRYL